MFRIRRKKVVLVGAALLLGAVSFSDTWAQGTVDTSPWIPRASEGVVTFRRSFDGTPRGGNRPDWKIEFIDPRALDWDNQKYEVANSNQRRTWDVKYDPNFPDRCRVRVADNARLTRPKTYQLYQVTVRVNNQRKFQQGWFRVFKPTVR